MPDEPNGEGQQQGEGQESSVIRELREKAKERDDAVARLAQIERERAFEKAGIDIEVGPGKLLFQSGQGDASDVESLKALAKEFSVPLRGEGQAQAGSGEGDQQTQQQGEAQTQQRPNEDTGSATRDLLAANAAADTPLNVDPRQEAVKVGDETMKQHPWEEGMARALGVLASAANSGDQRVILDNRTGTRRGPS